MNTPLFSIITPSFQAGEKLAETVRSVLSQSFDDYEIIVKDAGSSDGSIERLPVNRRIRLIRCADRGIYDGMNQAILAARGEYLYFLNCGDRLHDDKVLQQVAENIEAAGRTGERGKRTERIFYGDVLEEKTGQRVNAKPSMTRFAMYRNLPCHQACIYSRELFQKRRFDVRYAVRADYEHFLWSVLEEGAETVAMDLVVADYEGGGFSETRENRVRSAAEHREITARYYTRKELVCYRAAMILSLQPLRERLASWKLTAGLYDRIKNAVYRKRKQDTEQ